MTSLLIRSRVPSWNNVNPKYHIAIECVIAYVKASINAFSCIIHSIYVRGSVVHGLDDRDSDLDMVVIVKFNNESNLNHLREVLRSLLYHNGFSFHIGLKIFCLDEKLNLLKCPGSHDAYLAQAIHRHIVLDLWANGIKVYGHEIAGHPPNFSTKDAFDKERLLFWGQDIELMLKQMLNKDIDLKRLIKRIFYLASMVPFNSEYPYAANIRDSVKIAFLKHPQYKRHLKKMHLALNDVSFYQTDQSLRCSVEKMANYLLQHSSQPKPIFNHKPRGKYLKLGNAGDIINTSNLSHVSGCWQLAVEYAVKVLLERFNEAICSIYIRGSLVQGTHADDSDIDLVVVTYIAIPPLMLSFNDIIIDIDRILRSHLCVQSDTYKSKNARSDQFIISTQTAHLYGEKIHQLMPKFKIDAYAASFLSYETSDLLARFHQMYLLTDYSAYVIKWIIKAIIRMCGILVMVREEKYTRDIVLNSQLFCKHYKNKVHIIEQLLDWFMNPPKYRFWIIFTYLETFCFWLDQEVKKEINTYMPLEMLDN